MSVPPRSSVLCGRELAVFFGLLVLVLVVDLRTFIQEALPLGVSNDYAHYFITSWHLLNGESPYGVTLTPFYETLGLVNQPKIDVATNPPGLALFFVPFVILGAAAAYWVWSAVQAVFLALSVHFLIQLSKVSISARDKWCLIGGALLMYPTFAHLQYGQAQITVLFLVVLGLRLYRPERPMVWALLWGVATSLKLFTWPLLFLCFAEAGFVAAAWFLVGFSVPTLMILFWDMGALSQYYQVAIPFIEDSLTRFNGSNSLPGAIYYSLRAMELDSASLLPWISRAAGVVLFSLTLVTVRNRKLTLVTKTAVVLLLSLLFSPTTWNHYMVLAVFPLALLFGRIQMHDWLIAFSLVALSQGYLSQEDIAWQLVSAWWGVFTCGYLVWHCVSVNDSVSQYPPEGQHILAVQAIRAD